MKKYVIGFSALFFALIVTLAVTAKEEPKATPELTAVWFDFNGSPGQENIASQYSVDGDNSPECPMNETYLCEILAVPQTGSPNLPDLSTIQQSRFKSAP